MSLNSERGVSGRAVLEARASASPLRLRVATLFVVGHWRSCEWKYVHRSMCERRVLARMGHQERDGRLHDVVTT